MLVGGPSEQYRVFQILLVVAIFLNIALWSAIARQTTHPDEFETNRVKLAVYSTVIGVVAGLIFASLLRLRQWFATASTTENDEKARTWCK